MPDGQAESDLLRQATAGDRAALSQLLLIHYDALRRHIAARITADVQPLVVAEDILHQTFVRAAEGVRSYEARHEGAFRGWLKTIAENLLKDVAKRRHRERRGSPEDRRRGVGSGSGSWTALVERIAADSSTPSVRGQRRETAGRLRSALAALPAEQREVLERYYLRDQSLEEIAEALGVTKDSVRGSCYRARKNLRALMGRSSLYFSG